MDRWLAIAAATAALFMSTSAAAQGAPARTTEINQRFIELEAQTQAIEHALQPTLRHSVRDRLRRAGIAWHNDVREASALYNVILSQKVTGPLRVHALIEAGRAEAATGATTAALKHFLAAAESSTQDDAITSAVEGFVAAAQRAFTLPGIPPIDRYIHAVESHGKLDTVAYHTLYRLGRWLVRSRDRRAISVLQRIPLRLPAGRRARYLLGVAQLEAGHAKAARATFRSAAEHPPYPDLAAAARRRDAHVRDLAWLAVGRLAFEAGDVPVGIYAYQQIPVDSPRFGEAFYELGWLALEAHQNKVALLAFTPLVETGGNSALARRAQLIKGYVMIQQGHYSAADAYYTAIAKRFDGDLATFDAEVAKIADPGALARDCRTRDAALKDPLLAPVLARPEVVAARKMTFSLEDLATQQFAIDDELSQVDAIQAGKGPNNLLQQLAKDRARVSAVLQQVGQLSLQVDERAQRTSWRAATTDPPGTVPRPCCADPRLRARHLRQRLEHLLAGIDARTQRVHQTLAAIHQNLVALRAQQVELYTELQSEVAQAQAAAVRHAIGAEHDELRKMVMEGYAGSLEAVWRYKEDHRELIRRAELQEKHALEALRRRYADSLRGFDIVVDRP